MEIPYAVHCLSSAKTGFNLVVMDKASRSAHLVDLFTGNKVHELDFPADTNEPPIVGLSGDGRYLAAATIESSNLNSSYLKRI